MAAIRVAIAQINPTVGDLKGNLTKVLEWMRRAESVKADIVVFPELVITGYPPEDLLLKQRFIYENLDCVAEITRRVNNTAVVVGYVGKEEGKIFNSAAFIANGKIKAACNKTILPNYGVFDEKRYFGDGKACPVFEYNGVKIALNVCEDIWHEDGPYKKQVKQGKAELVININASPYHAGKIHDREIVLKDRLKEGKAYIVYANMVGGQDELVFDGGSFVMNKTGKIIAMTKQFEEDMLVIDLPLGKKKASKEKKPPIKPAKNKVLQGPEEVYSALTLAVRDYVRKNGFKKILIGLSGGIDSGITACIAADALGKENVNCVFMPSQYTAERSREDATALARALGVNLIEEQIDSIFVSYLSTLQSEFRGMRPDITEENLQARIRGTLLMALSNKFNWLVLTTGNKSEMSVGYATLYGDMAGGFAVLKDIPKTLVYKLSNWRNRKEDVIPQSMIDREPTAELKPDQKDQDTLPPYDQLDAIVELYVVQNKSFKEILKEGFKPEVVAKVIRMVDHSEYKRRQAPPGPKIGHRAFGKDWRLPITNLYKG